MTQRLCELADGKAQQRQLPRSGRSTLSSEPPPLTTARSTSFRVDLQRTMSSSFSTFEKLALLLEQGTDMSQSQEEPECCSRAPALSLAACRHQACKAWTLGRLTP